MPAVNLKGLARRLLNWVSAIILGLVAVLLVFNSAQGRWINLRDPKPRSPAVGLPRQQGFAMTIEPTMLEPSSQTLHILIRLRLGAEVRDRLIDDATRQRVTKCTTLSCSLLPSQPD